MKLSLLCVGVSLYTLYACQPFFSHSNNQETKMPVTNISAPRIDWRLHGELPAAKGMTSSIGISASFTGLLGSYLLVGGAQIFLMVIHFLIRRLKPITAIYGCSTRQRQRLFHLIICSCPTRLRMVHWFTRNIACC